MEEESSRFPSMRTPGRGSRQISLLARESIEKRRKMGLDVGPGDFAENVTGEGVDIPAIRVGERVRVGEALLEITQVGKECHDRCAIYVDRARCSDFPMLFEVGREGLANPFESRLYPAFDHDRVGHHRAGIGLAIAVTLACTLLISVLPPGAWVNSPRAYQPG